jgi:hypothetical protein
MFAQLIDGGDSDRDIPINVRDPSPEHRGKYWKENARSHAEENPTGDGGVEGERGRGRRRDRCDD